jgi:galactokinase
VDALGRDDFDELGRLFVASHVSMRDDFEISVAALDTAVDAALSAGALGARMTGGGFGGSAIALIHSSAVEPTISAVEKAFSDKGFRPPVCFPVTASGPARREV